MYFKKHICTITFLVASYTSYTTPAMAELVNIVNNTSNHLHFVQQPQLPDNGTPTGRRKGAAGRGNCSLEPPLTALVPEIEQTLDSEPGKITYVWGKTFTEQPTFWFYIPYERKELRSIEFVLQEGENDFYRTSLALPATPGVVSVPLPATKTLELDKMYHWFLKLNVNCTPQEPTIVKDYVEGWVQRVQLSPELKTQLDRANLQQRIAIYVANDIWHEALTTLIENRDDVSLKANWTQLLQLVGLSDIASKTFVDCCTLKTNYSFQGIKTITHDHD